MVRRLLVAVGDLEQSLQSETAALVAGDAGELLAAVEQKRRAVRAVERIVRESTGTGTGAKASGEPASPLQSRLERSPEWPRLLERLTRCQLANQAAGGAIAAARRGTAELLRALGQAPAATIYDGDGHTAVDRGSRGIGVC